MHPKHLFLKLVSAALFCSLISAFAQSPGPVSSVPGAIPLVLTETAKAGDFELAGAGRAADIFVAKDDFSVVRIAADCLASDVERVAGAKPRIKSEAAELSGAAVLIGTMGKSPVIDELIRTGRLQGKQIAGQWESFVIATVTNPVPGVNIALVIAGSDRRGTAYGVFTLSEAIGVSPWIWWADVSPPKRAALVIRTGTIASLPPSVKYRGIFINDEDWGLQPWAAKTFEPETSDIGPKTYAKVCELLLRLKANYLWPAMHPCTKAFNIYPQNKIVANDYAIVMGSSHCEQMLRNNVTEYDEHKFGPWDYDKNRANILGYWEQRLEENGKFEGVYTIGMRGIHDGGMPGGGTTLEKVARLQRVIDDQRELVAKNIDPDPSAVPQIFCPYKEVLTLYQNGLKVPPDVTLVWPDDNHGYIRQLSNPEERKRAGGSGVYYHISYWGAPEDYLWISTTPPAVIWEEMHKAWEQGARNVWVVNVGDIKPAEIGMEFFLRMAWNIGPWNETAQPKFLTDWAGRNFGKENADQIAAVLEEYYRLNFPARPEHLYLSQFTTNYNEIGTRLQRFAQLVKKTDAIYEKLPREQRDAFYELVVYPVRGAAAANEMHLGASADQAQQAYDRIQAETRYFNEDLAGGKWRHIMSSNPRNRPGLRKPNRPPTASASVSPVDDHMKPLDGFISLEAERPTRATAGSGVDWKVIQGLGRSGDSIALLPTTAGVPTDAALEYDFTVEKTGAIKALVYCLPTQPIFPGLKARYSVSIDAGVAKVVDIATAEFSRPWSTNVLRAAAIGTTDQVLPRPGKHTLKIQPLDPGLVFDKIVIDLGGLKPTHLGPPEPRALERAE